MSAILCNQLLDSNGRGLECRCILNKGHKGIHKTLGWKRAQKRAVKK